MSMTDPIADFLTRGFDVFGNQFVRTGDFDRILLRPRSAALQLIGYEFRLARFGRFAQGLGAVLLASALLGLPWTAPKLLLALWTVSGGVALFVGILILQATLALRRDHGGRSGSGRAPAAHAWDRFSMTTPGAHATALRAAASIGATALSGG